MRTSRVEYGEAPYKWGIDSQGQCTWFVYYYCIEKGLPAPCYWDRRTKTGSYTTANKWLENYREPWVVKPVGYIPVANDIVVFDGYDGHVAFIEKVNGNIATLYQYNVGVKLDFSIKEWQTGTDYTGKLLGYLHCEQGTERNINVDQVFCTDTDLRIREKPSLEANIVGHVSMTYYDVLNESDADGYHWYKIGKDKWIANIGTKYYPKNQEEYDDDILAELDKIMEQFKDRQHALKLEIADKNERLKKIKELCL